MYRIFMASLPCTCPTKGGKSHLDEGRNTPKSSITLSYTSCSSPSPPPSYSATPHPKFPSLPVPSISGLSRDLVFSREPCLTWFSGRHWTLRDLEPPWPPEPCKDTIMSHSLLPRPSAWFLEDVQ